MATPASLPEIDEALANVAEALRRIQFHKDRRRRLEYADRLLEQRTFLAIVLAETWETVDG
jgi:ribosomal 50S subunit-associated protein YjgA (DUF615 family)